MSASEPTKPTLGAISFDGFQVLAVQLEQSPSAEEVEKSYIIDFQPSGKISWKKGRFELRLGIAVNSSPDLFSIQLETVSLFSFEAGNSNDDIKKLLKNNTLPITYPYVRAYVSALTSLSGLPTVTMPTLHLVQISEVLSDNLTEVDDL